MTRGALGVQTGEGSYGKYGYLGSDAYYSSGDVVVCTTKCRNYDDPDFDNNGWVNVEGAPLS